MLSNFFFITSLAEFSVFVLSYQFVLISLKIKIVKRCITSLIRVTSKCMKIYDVRIGGVGGGGVLGVNPYHYSYRSLRPCFVNVLSSLLIKKKEFKEYLQVSSSDSKLVSMLARKSVHELARYSSQ